MRWERISNLELYLWADSKELCKSCEVYHEEVVGTVSGYTTPKRGKRWLSTIFEPDTIQGGWKNHEKRGFKSEEEAMAYTQTVARMQ